MKPIQLFAWFGRNIYRSIKKFDLFSQRIMLTYKGENSFSTLLGGVISLIIMAVVWVYTAFLFQTMINRENSNNSKSSAFVDLSVQDEDYYRDVSLNIINLKKKWEQYLFINNFFN